LPKTIFESDRKENKLALFCPFCSEEITPETAECPSCGHTYDSDLLQFFRSSYKESPDERRRQGRFSKKLKVAYATPKEFINSYIFNLSVGGLFIETKEPLDQGQMLNLKVFLPNKGENLDVTGEVMWSSRKETATSERNYPPGMGVKFLNLSTVGIKRIISVLTQT
jgi:uncharacterized protein (TIGR02266 family)